MRQPIATFILLAAFGMTSCAREVPAQPPSEPAPPWQLKHIEQDMQDYFGHRLKNVRLLAWRLGIICSFHSYGVSYGEYVLLSAEGDGKTGSGPEWLLILAHLNEGKWVVDNDDCPHCKGGDRTLYLKRPPRAEDVQSLVKRWWVDMAAFDNEQLVASGVDKESWRALLGDTPVLVFAPTNPPPVTCYRPEESE